jgi:integrase
MAYTLEKTKTPGIFKRGSRYVFVYRANGKQKWESARTLDEARRKKSERHTDVGRGEFEERSRLPLREYAEAWIERYLGRGRGGFREGTRDEYRRQLEQYIYPYFASAKLTEITPSRMASFVAWLCDEKAQGRRVHEQRRKAEAEKLGVPLSQVEREKDPKLALSDATVRNILAPLRACLAAAVREGLIRSNPARDVDLPHRPTAEGSEEEQVRAMTRSELDTLLALIPDRHRLLFRVLASTGLRISEAVALQWRHLQLDGSSPHVKVRRALVKGRMGPPKLRAATAGGRSAGPRARPRASEGPQGRRVAGRRAPCVPGNQRCRAEPAEPLPGRAQVAPRGGEPLLGRVPHLPAHLRVDAVRGGPQRRAGTALARPPFPGLHAGPVRPPARRRPRRAVVFAAAVLTSLPRNRRGAWAMRNGRRCG